VTVSVRDARANARDRQWIESVYRDYLDDLSPLNTGVFSATSLGEIGYSESDQLARWLKKSREIQWDYKNIYKTKGKLKRIT